MVPDIVARRTVSCMNNAQQSALSRLLSGLRRTEGVRRDSATTRDLASARRIGDEARLDMWRVRGN